MVLVDCPKEPVTACATGTWLHDETDYLTESGRFPIITDE
jgi:hypothetical protein